jgi:hypothetical protein
MRVISRRWKTGPWDRERSTGRSLPWEMQEPKLGFEWKSPPPRTQKLKERKVGIDRENSTVVIGTGGVEGCNNNWIKSNRAGWKAGWVLAPSYQIDFS